MNEEEMADLIAGLVEELDGREGFTAYDIGTWVGKIISALESIIVIEKEPAEAEAHA